MQSKSRLYHIWNGMRHRCNNKNNPRYQDWGGRGINICNEWQHDFEKFVLWAIKNGYDDTLSIDRKNNDRGYSPDNCRWVTMHEQISNRRIMKNNTSGFVGVFPQRGKYQAQIRINRKCYYIGVFDTAIEAAIARDKFIIMNNLSEYKTQILNKGTDNE